MAAHSLPLSLPAQVYLSLIPLNLVVVRSLSCLVSLPQVISVEPVTCCSSQNPSSSVSIPRPACGKGRLSWVEVRGRACLGYWLCKF